MLLSLANLAPRTCADLMRRYWPCKSRVLQLGLVFVFLASGPALQATLLPGRIQLSCTQPDPHLNTCDYKTTAPEKPIGISARAEDIFLPVRRTSDYPGLGEKSAALFLVDTSDPARNAAVKRGAQHVVTMLEASQPHHRLGLAKFDADLVLMAPLGSTQDTLRTAAQALRARGLTTELYRNVLEAVRLMAVEQAARKAVYVFSDGLAEDRAYTHDDVVSAARDAGVVIYGIGYARSRPKSVALQVVRRLAEETGGEFINATVDSPDVFAFLEAPYGSLDSGGQFEIDLSPLAGTAGEMAAETEVEVTFRFPSTTSTTTHAVAVPPAPEPEVEPEPEAEPGPEIQPEPMPVVVDAPVEETQEEPKEEPKEEPQQQPVVAEAPKVTGFFEDRALWWYVLVGAVSALLLTGLLGLLLGRLSIGGMELDPYAYLWQIDEDPPLRFNVVSAVTRIGRHKHNECRLSEKTVSRFHAELIRNEFGKFTVVDRGSKNGLRVGDRLVSSSALQEGDVIGVGDVYLRFTYLPKDYSTFEDTELYSASIVPEQRTRRLNTRKPVGADVRIFHGDIGWVRGRLADLSIDGAFVETDQKFPAPRTRVDLVIPIITEKVRRWYRFPAELIRQTDTGIGVAFQELSPASSRWLEFVTKAA